MRLGALKLTATGGKWIGTGADGYWTKENKRSFERALPLLDVITGVG